MQNDLRRIEGHVLRWMKAFPKESVESYTSAQDTIDTHTANWVVSDARYGMHRMVDIIGIWNDEFTPTRAQVHHASLTLGPLATLVRKATNDPSGFSMASTRTANNDGWWYVDLNNQDRSDLSTRLLDLLGTVFPNKSRNQLVALIISSIDSTDATAVSSEVDADGLLMVLHDLAVAYHNAIRDPNFQTYVKGYIDAAGGTPAVKHMMRRFLDIVVAASPKPPGSAVNPPSPQPRPQPPATPAPPATTPEKENKSWVYLTGRLYNNAPDLRVLHRLRTQLQTEEGWLAGRFHLLLWFVFAICCILVMRRSILRV